MGNQCIGCQRCGSADIVQGYTWSPIGILIFVIALGATFAMFGKPMSPAEYEVDQTICAVAGIVGLLMWSQRGKCRSCGWRWRC